MKQLFLISGLSLLSTVAFSQQVSSERKVTITPVPTETNAPQQVSDTVIVHMTMGRMAKPDTRQVEPVSLENQQTSKSQPEPVVNSAKRKPE